MIKLIKTWAHYGENFIKGPLKVVMAALKKKRRKRIRDEKKLEAQTKQEGKKLILQIEKKK